MDESTPIMPDDIVNSSTDSFINVLNVRLFNVTSEVMSSCCLSRMPKPRMKTKILVEILSVRIKLSRYP